MTIGAWILWGVLAIFVVGLGICIGIAINDDGSLAAVIGGFIGLFVAVAVLFGMRWYFSNTANGARALKTQESNFNQGIPREVTVYDVNGKVIKEYKGKFDVVYDDDRIWFDDENGLRHIIYYPTGTVIIDELKENDK